MAAVPLFRDTNMAAVTSRENTIVYICPEIQVIRCTLISISVRVRVRVRLGLGLVSNLVIFWEEQGCPLGTGASGE